MKKAIVVLLSSILMSSVCGCSFKDGDMQNTVQEGTVKYEVLLNSGSCFVYTFQDPETGVWYMCTSRGITVRLNEDGSLYK